MLQLELNELRRQQSMKRRSYIAPIPLSECNPWLKGETEEECCKGAKVSCTESRAKRVWNLLKQRAVEAIRGYLCGLEWVRER